MHTASSVPRSGTSRRADGMIGYIIRRLAQAVIVVLGVTAVTFALEHLIPGSLARAILGPRASRPEVAAFNRASGLDHPVRVPYLIFPGRPAPRRLGSPHPPDT